LQTPGHHHKLLCWVAFLAGCACAPQQARFAIEPCAEAVLGDPSASAAKFRAEPAIEPGPAGAWDSVDALNPSVVEFRGRLLNIYSGYDGAVWRSGVASSDDGIRWSKGRGNPVVEPDAAWEGEYIAANGAALAVGDELLYWYQAGPRNRTSIGLARSADGAEWRKEATPVFGPGARGAWDESAVADPYVIRCGETFYLYYLGQNRFGIQRLGVARSHDGRAWQRSHLNPILEPGGQGAFDERGLGEPAVIYSAGGWRLLYVGRDDHEVRRMGWAESADGVRWQKLKRGRIEGAHSWDRAVICDPTFLPRQGRLWMWYGGGDRASPDENLNGRIGLAVF
jgi:predicted GH43/DUF377 family glycosyl hydrolase